MFIYNSAYIRMHVHGTLQKDMVGIDGTAVLPRAASCNERQDSGATCHNSIHCVRDCATVML